MMIRPLSSSLATLLLCLLLPAQVGQAQVGQAQGEVAEKAYARVPLEIALQNDSHWEDNRWQQTDVGPFLAGSIATPAGLTLKGMAIRVGQSGQAAVCYDTARCRLSAAWTGGFLNFDPRRFGVIRHPAAAGEIFLSTKRLAGWARDGDFETDQGDQITRLPEDWISYRGFYTHNERVVLSYSVGGVPVLESPWHAESNSDTDGNTTSEAGFIRSLEIGPSEQLMQMWLSDSPAVATIADVTGNASIVNEGRVLSIPPHQQAVRVKVLLTRSQDAVARLLPLVGKTENLSAWIETDQGRFGETLTTVGTTTESGGPYVVDTLTLPFENPWKALLFTAGHDFFSDGTAAICTLHGDVWTVSGIDRDLKELRWRRYATGLSQPLGLKIVDDRVYVINRTQLTRLHDRNGDGEADQYECFNNDNSTTPGVHDYVTCLETDTQGNFHYIHARTGVMKISPDGKRSEVVADGFRNPNGMGVSPEGTITAAPQQGQWTPQSSLIVVRKDGYYGYGGPRINDQRPTGWDLPMCFIPHSMDNSGGGQVWVQSNRWGPLSGRMLHLSYGQCRILLAVEEESRQGGVVQGGTIEFPTLPGDFESGIMRGRFRPADGQLYVSGLRGWQTRAIRDGCFQRVRYTGGPVHLPVDVHTYRNGIQLSFTETLDQATASDPNNYFVSQWNYLWSAEYGSPEFSVERPQEQGRDEVPVVSATLLADGRSVFLEMPGRHPVNQMTIDYSLQSERGVTFRGKYAHTINLEPAESFPDSAIVRRRLEPLVSGEVIARLKPGLSAKLTSIDAGRSDYRVLRMAAARDRVDSAPSVFLPAGRFESEIKGTIKIALSGSYQFRLEGTGEIEVNIRGEVFSNSVERDQESPTIRLQKGHNPVRVRYRSPDRGIAAWKLWWKGHDFDWEPVPPDALFHDAGLEEQQSAAQRRLGRQLVATHRCVQCHRTELGSSPMFETTLAAPDLAKSASRLNPEWIEQWLLEPASLHPHPAMPALLPENAPEHAANIAAFLTAGNLGTLPAETLPAETLPAETLPAETLPAETLPAETLPAETLPAETLGKLKKDGEAMFESLGCITCHHFEQEESSPRNDRLSLHFAAAKYRTGAIAEFLLNPAQHHTASRMPNFALSGDQASALATYIRAASRGRINPSGRTGDLAAGISAVATFGCQHCHAIGSGSPMLAAKLPWRLDALDRGCLAGQASNLSKATGRNKADRNESRRDEASRDEASRDEASRDEASRDEASRDQPAIPTPRFTWSDTELAVVRDFVATSLVSLQTNHPAETSQRLVETLRCSACHDRDGVRSPRPRIIAEEGSGRLPEVIPSLTLLGEKFHSDWNRRLFGGALEEKPRPWLTARMPAFPGYADALATGLAIEHAIDPQSPIDHSFDPKLAAIGERLTLETGLDCRQCHAIGDLQPRGDQKTQIALGINFDMIRDRMRHPAYHRFMLDPPRYDINTKMIKLSENGITTKLKSVYDQDAKKQFEAVWHYMQSLRN
ncbi:MAG: hypothetical protein P8L85_24735 [Rubripirellula sp.]|nr:hypothetical protein [Rubripirellula sp.]